MDVGRLKIDGDITRFISSDFPHQVTIYLKEKQITCSGLVLAYHSAVLENKIREENGAIMLDEMYEDENNDECLENCIKLLHGQAFSAINRDLKSVSLLLKFSVWYEVDALFELALELLDINLPKVVTTDEDFMEWTTVYSICNAFQSRPEHDRIKQLLLNRISVGELTAHLETTGNQNYFTGSDIAAIISNFPDNSGKLLHAWIKLFHSFNT